MAMYLQKFMNASGHGLMLDLRKIMHLKSKYDKLPAATPPTSKSNAWDAWGRV